MIKKNSKKLSKNKKDSKKELKKDSKKESKKNSKKESKNDSKKELKKNDKIEWKDGTIKSRNIYSDLEYKLEPIKLIYKYRNNNKKNQYLTYIYVGEIGKKYESILKKIEDLNLYNTLITITREEELKLIEGFGDLWMTKFFNIYHISAFVNRLETKPDMKKELLKKYDENWILKFISKFKNDIVFKKINYSYSDLIKLQYKIKMGKKLEKVMLEKEDIEDISFVTENKVSKKNNILYDINEIVKEGGFNNSNRQFGSGSGSGSGSGFGGSFGSEFGSGINGGGEGDYEEESDYIQEDLVDDNYMDDDLTNEDFDPQNLYKEEKNKDKDKDKEEETDDVDVEIASVVSIESNETNEEINLEEIERIYQVDELDKNATNTGSLISNILDNNKIIEKKKNYMIKFDDSKDEEIDNEDLSQVYGKKFVYTQYIFKDDSIKVVKNKISSSIRLNNKFGNDMYLLPSRMYLWSEYLINNSVEKVMIGQKWMKKNELLNIDIEPLELNYYENLEGSIKVLRDTLKRYAGKIRREDEDNNILFDYSDYMLNDTIFMIDIYNELGLKFKANTEQVKNLTETYFKIYFPRIKNEDIKGIFDLLNKTDEHIEKNKIKNSFDTIYNDLVMENEITELIEKTKVEKQKEYNELFSNGNFIVQSVIHVYLDIYDEQLTQENKENMSKINKTSGEYGSVSLPKLDLFRIFNDFTPDSRYPFIQYQIPDGQIIFKYYEKYMYEFSKTKNNIDILTKWFENSPYGISFKVRLDTDSNEVEQDKIMAINISEIGKVDYKTQWKEEDNANIDDITNTYGYLKDLVIKINETLLNHPRKISIRIPEDWEFRFAFINCIQKFKLPDNKIIDHNDLSEFCRFFYPYIALQIEPKKRLSKLSVSETKSKYGSYLRYKRVSKFENQGKIEQRILTYLKNFDFDDDLLSEEISKQFNITSDKAKDEIVKVRGKFPNVIKGKKAQLKASDDIPKFKPPGIDISIQGKVPEKYKIRISGAREQNQLERIIVFMNILIFLYSETYIKKNPEYQAIKEKLRKLTNIAKRRSKVDEVVNYQKEVKVVKQMTQIDKKRLGFTPDEGQNQWTRSCQNSGNDKKRRPRQTTQLNISELVAKGYHLNKKTGEYEKKILLGKRGKSDGEMILKAIKVTDQDEASGVVNDIYYSCDPEDNGTHMYVGFLTRSNNPFGECMPCCFKKNPLISKKKEKQDFYKRCMGEKKEEDNTQPTSAFTGDILYILQDTNKIQEGRIGYLPKFLDLITNIHFKKNKEIKNHYLVKTDGFYFKYGINQDDYSFLNTISTILNMSVQEIKSHIIDFLKSDTDEMYYFSLNEGDIRAEYRIGDFIRFIEEQEYIDYYYLKDLLKIPGLFTKKGILPIIFNKSATIIKKGVEREKIKEDFYLQIDKTMVVDFDYCLDMFNTHDILIMIKDGKFYYPVVEIIKEDENSKSVQVIKLFNKEDKKDIRIIDVTKNFFIKTIQDIKIDINKTNTSARETYLILSKIAKKNPDFEVTHQVIDSRYKCKYLITKMKVVIPVHPSGIIDQLPTICLNTVEYANKPDCFSKLKFISMEKTNKYLEELYKLTDKKLNIKPIGLFYDYIDEKDNVNVIGIMTSNNDFVPIEKVSIEKKTLDKNKILYQNRPLFHELDQKLANYTNSHFDFIDERIKNVNLSKYNDESYQLFRFELSNLLSDKKYSEFKTQLKDFISKKDTVKIQNLLLNISLGKLNNKITNKSNLLADELVKIINDLPDLSYYKVNNQRVICSNLDENKCLTNPHCVYNSNNVVSKSDPKCSLALTENKLLNFIKKLSVELVEQEIKAYEILREKKYFVSDIVDYNNFTEKPGQKIIKSTNTNLQKILTDIFGKEHVPKIGRRYLNKKLEVDLQTLLLENPLKDIKDSFVQNIIPYNYSILRSYINGYYWLKHELYTPDTRNLGYYSDLQNEIVNIFRSMIIDWLNVPDNIKYLTNLDSKTKSIINNPILYLNKDSNKEIIINTYIVKLMENNIESNLGLFELFILKQIHGIQIVILNNGILKYLISDSVKELNSKQVDNKYNQSKYICINLDISEKSQYPNIIEVIYWKDNNID
jgi:hypothetical protein